MIQALRDDYRLTLLSWTPVDLEEVNRYFGTSLRSGDFTARLPSARTRRLLNALPLPISTAKAGVLRRRCKAIASNFDLIMGAHGEADFGRPGIQFVHYPVRHVAALPVNLHWYHRRWTLALYDRCWSLISPFDDASMRTNVTLVNSAWTGRLVSRIHGIPVQVIYPPAPGDFEAVPWARREDGFLCVGRLSPEKRVEDAIEIVGRVRQRRPDAHLHIVGADDRPRYAEFVRGLARRAGPWVTTEGVASAEKLASLLSRHRYLLHAMPEEHFGMSVAQAVRAGCIPFVPDSGGQVEIVGDEPALRYRSLDEAVANITTVMADPHLQAAMLARLAIRGERFAPTRFMEDIRRAAAAMLARTGVNATRRT